MSATISPCGRYRYTLHRKISTPLRWIRPVMFIMLNPSTADASKDDPTIRRCISFAERWGCTSLTVVNLFALRSTDPRALILESDPVGPENNMHIADQMAKHQHGFVVAAWGTHPAARVRAEEIIRKYGTFQCLGLTKAGHPRHPLYVASSALLRPYPPGESSEVRAV